MPQNAGAGTKHPLNFQYMSDTPTIREMHGLSDKPRTFDQVAITVADPDTIRSW